MAPPDDPALTSILTDSKFATAKENYFSLSDNKLVVKNVPLLFQVPENVTLTKFTTEAPPRNADSDVPDRLSQRAQSTSHKAAFLGFTQDNASHRLLNSLGKFTDRDFLSIFRFKTWWSTQWVGKSGSDLQMETQWLMINVPEINSYVLIVPLIQGSFRSALFPGSEAGEVVVAAESGSSLVKTAAFSTIAYVHVSENPYNLMREAYCAIRVHLDTFRLLEEKSVAPLVDKFGWCTWDAFYLSVDPAGVWHGLKEFSEGGISPRFLIIDDGWQSINRDDQDIHEDANNLVLGGTQMTSRLHRFEECEKFGKYKAGSFSSSDPRFDPTRPKMLISKAIEIEQAEKARDRAAKSGVTDLSSFELRIQKLKHELDQKFKGGNEGDGDSELGLDNCSSGLKAFTKDLRARFKGLDDIYMWHALCGYWGGVRPGATSLSSRIIPCKLSSGLDGTMEDLAVVKIIEGSIGLVEPQQAYDLYDSMHSYLASAGVTGVKVDVIHSLEYVSEEYGGRIELAKAYYEGLSKSLAKNFNGTGLIASMQQCNDFFFLGTQQISLGRVGDDFWFQDPNGDPNGVYWLQGVHMIHCAYNSLWMGQIIQPDWDMFQTDHLCATFHGASRAICGGPVYVSDSLGGHDFHLLNKLVFPDGTIPKCNYMALPTRDCLFKNPLFDGNTILKIWNLNQYGGVIGAFNCQGGGWDPKEQRFKGHPDCYKVMTGSVHVAQIEWGQTKEASAMGEAPQYAVYLSQAEKLILKTPDPISGIIEMTIQPSSFEIYSFVPVHELLDSDGVIVKFAPIGITDMFNPGGTIRDLEYKGSSIGIQVKGGGCFLCYSSITPKKCSLNGSETKFKWSGEDGKLELNLLWDEEAGGISSLSLGF